MAKFVPALNLSSLKHLATYIGRAQTWEVRNCATSVGRAVSSLASNSNDGVITEVASEQQSKEKKKVFWMRDPTTGDWIPEDHFGEIDVADLRAKLLPCRN